MITAKQAFNITENSGSESDECEDSFLYDVMDQIRDSANAGEFDTIINISDCKDFPEFARIIEQLGYDIFNVSYLGKDDEREKIMRVISWECAG